MKFKLLKSTSLLLSLFFMLSLLHNIFAFTIGATDFESETIISDKKVFSNATITDDFANNGLLIVLNKSETQKFKNYTKEDFSEINVANIKNLTESTSNIVKSNFLSYASYDNFTDSIGKSAINHTTFDYMTAEYIENFRTILYVELAEKGKENVLNAIKKLENNDEFIYVGPDYHMYIYTTPNDTDYSEQWGLEKIHASTAWDIRTKASSSVHIGVVDSGIQANHPDLTNQIYSSKHRDFTTGVVNGITVEVNDLIDSHGHGTHVAGIISAQGNNYIGGTGVCWDSNIISLRVMGDDNQGNVSHLINAINYAQAANIDILNISLGTYAYDTALETAIRNYTGLIVAAAGNNDNNTDEIRNYPSSFTATLDNVISVGASDSNDERANWNGFLNLWGVLGNRKSNYGKTTVDIFAPGTDIYSTTSNGTYDKMSGSSMAAPYVTGVAALMMSFSPTLRPADIKHAINYTADTKSSLTDLCVSGGRLNAAEAVKAAANTFRIPISSTSRYTERTMSISPDVGFMDFVVSFAYSGNRVIQTFGANTLIHDGFLEIYDINGTRLCYDDDSGYERNALISYYFEANISYRIRVKFCSTSAQLGNVRLAIIPTYVYNTYEDIYALTNYTLGLTWNFAQNNVKVMTYKYTITQELTMRVSSETDSVLYIIDPSSSERCYEIWDYVEGSETSYYPSLCNNNYCNEYGECIPNPKLKKSFEAGIPYLVIVSADNPGSNESTGSFYVDFE